MILNALLVLIHLNFTATLSKCYHPIFQMRTLRLKEVKTEQ